MYRVKIMNSNAVGVSAYFELTILFHLNESKHNFTRHFDDTKFVARRDRALSYLVICHV